MGSFSKTCSLTNQAIHPGDEVFFIDSKRQTYELLSAVGAYIRAKQDYEQLSIDLPEFKQPPIQESRQLEFGFGTYDDYGGVTNYTKRFNGDGLGMIHRYAVDQITGNDSDNLQVLYKLLTFMMDTRKPIIYTSIIGRQYCDREEINAQKKLAEITKTIIKTREEEVLEYENE